ncbi:MAG TPA: hypothetical protein VLL97_07300 [Acidobacteriota bacterium]|nr:hypothetical protein [Acidobacteriota bacterium]
MTKRNSILSPLPAAAICFMMAFMLSASSFASEQNVPVLDAEIGRCAVSFTVAASDNTPLYNARISVVVRHGFLGMRRLSLEMGTDSSGRARIIGLPESPREHFEFEITSAPYHRIVRHFPSSNCGQDRIDVRFGPQDIRQTEP